MATHLPVINPAWCLGVWFTKRSYWDLIKSFLIWLEPLFLLANHVQCWLMNWTLLAKHLFRDEFLFALSFYALESSLAFSYAFFVSWALIVFVLYVKFACRDVLNLTIGVRNLFVCSSAPGDQSGVVPWCLFRPLYRLPFGFEFKAFVLAPGLFCRCLVHCSF
ncbi:hypothetical protein PIB30_043255 [Stylosanthes scabra]|uniref:Uncharacterized protein n=1 Tax=Stylosanthes scabra TaxID=79078 RepID=A0ABU6TH94_9FABA|nr:hypothetical protein [Stylosanthes scabra]